MMNLHACNVILMSIASKYKDSCHGIQQVQQFKKKKLHSQFINRLINPSWWNRRDSLLQNPTPDLDGMP